MPKHFITLASLVVFGLLVGYAVFYGRYPVMLVNGTMISEQMFQKRYDGAIAYYRSALQTYTAAAAIFGADERRELKRAALASLVEEALVHAELARREPKELANIIENKISEALKNPDFANAARTLYGLNLADAKRHLLAPQAEREILEGRLFLEKRTLEEWLDGAKLSASVTIFLPGFSWNGSEIVAE